MDWLLKIVEGPLKGAEIALVGGRRVSVGSGDACDIVIADQTLAAKAFDLDVADAGVTAVLPDGSARALKPFEIHAFGTTALAVGPTDRAWDALTPAPAEEPAPEETSAPAEEEAPKPEEEAATPAEETAPAPRRRRGCGCGLLVLLLLILLAVAAWFTRDRWLPKARAWYEARTNGAATTRVVTAGPSLGELAVQHGLTLVETNGARRLVGNVARRTERLAIRALALADDAQVQFDLTDDETVRSAADALLFTVTEGALKATAASNRVVTLAGYAATPARLERALRALSADVPAVTRVLTDAVQVGGPPPPKPEAALAAPEADDVVAAAPAAAAAAPARHLEPIAGILMNPYPCVVLRTGLRLAEGAQLGNATIVRIEAERLVLRDGATEFEWRP